jgi:hypothetical protein
MTRRGVHALFGCAILVGLLAIGLAFTFATAQSERTYTWQECGSAPTC